MKLSELASTAARTGAGVVLLLAPGPVADTWLGSRSRAARRVVRAVAVRDLAIVAGQTTGPPARRAHWRRAGAVADLSDAAVAVVVAIGRRRPSTLIVAVPALTSAALALRGDRHDAGGSPGERRSHMALVPTG